MKAEEIRGLSEAEIEQRIAEDQERLHGLRFQHAIADIQNPMELRHLRRNLARLRTILKQKQATTES